MKKKYFFFDIDGTLTDQSRNIVPSAKETILKLQEAGHFVAVATGRAHYRSVDLTSKVGIHNLVCCGGTCIAINDEIVYNETLDIDACFDILKHAEENEIGWLVTLNDTDACYMKDFRYLEQAGRRNEATQYIYQPDMDYRNLIGIIKIYLSIPQEEEEQHPWIKQLPYLRFNSSFIVFEEDKKKYGILHMMDLIGGPLEDIVVFGDSSNDLSMFDSRWTSIAMGNGSDELKEKADYVTTSNVEDGIKNACIHFGWIE